MKAYLVLDFTVTDLPGFMPYVNAIPAHIERHHGLLCAIGDQAA